MNTIISTNINPAYAKYSTTCDGKIPVLVMNIVMKFPKVTVKYQKPISTDFMLLGAWMKANSRPGMANRTCWGLEILVPKY
jgi:hypothetical protein